MSTTDYTIEGDRLFHHGRDTRIVFVRTSNHHWELHSPAPDAGFDVPAPHSAHGNFHRAFVAACELDRASRARCAAFNALHDLAAGAD